MLVKALGILDLLIALVLFLMAFNVVIPFLLLIAMVVILAAKSVPFILNFDLASIIDVLVAILIGVNFFVNIPTFLFLVVALAVGQKGVFSLL